MSDRCTRVWAALIERYGDAITREYGEAPPEHWRETIDSLADVELERALNRLEHDPPATRPNALEFVELARPPARRRRCRGPLTSEAARREYFAVEPATPDRVDQHLARIRATLGHAQASR